jgi:hypothetical protein
LDGPYGRNCGDGLREFLYRPLEVYTIGVYAIHIDLHPDALDQRVRIGWLINIDLQIRLGDPSNLNFEGCGLVCGNINGGRHMYRDFANTDEFAEGIDVVDEAGKRPIDSVYSLSEHLGEFDEHSRKHCQRCRCLQRECVLSIEAWLVVGLGLQGCSEWLRRSRQLEVRVFNDNRIGERVGVLVALPCHGPLLGLNRCR